MQMLTSPPQVTSPAHRWETGGVPVRRRSCLRLAVGLINELRDPARPSGSDRPDQYAPRAGQVTRTFTQRPAALDVLSRRGGGGGGGMSFFKPKCCRATTRVGI